MNNNYTILCDQVELEIDSAIAQLVNLRNKIGKIKDSATKLPNVLAGVSTPAPDNGLSAEKIAKVLSKRDKTRKNKINKAA